MFPNAPVPPGAARRARKKRRSNDSSLALGWLGGARPPWRAGPDRGLARKPWRLPLRKHSIRLDRRAETLGVSGFGMANGRPRSSREVSPRSVEARFSDSSGSAGLGGAARAKPELSTPPVSGTLPWSWIWRRAEGVRLPGCFGENNPRLSRSPTPTQNRRNFSSSYLSVSARDG